MYSPITRSCIGTIFEKQIVLRCNLLILVLNVRCFLSDELRILIAPRLNEMTEEVIASITGRAHVLKALSVVNI
jgi:hypothetical protein